MVNKGYDVAWVMSMFQVRCQDHWTGPGLGLGFSEAVERGIVTFRPRVLLLR